MQPRAGLHHQGKRDKRLPLFEPLTTVLAPSRPGLLFVRRRVAEGRERPPLLGKTMAELAAELQRRLKQEEAAGPVPAARRERLRDEVLYDAGATSYDRIEGKFTQLARRLNWPAATTLKDLRHLFATAMAAAGMPEPYRQYLMGHAPSSAAISVYTHVSRLRELYLAAVEKELRPLVEALRRLVRTPPT